jgi:hypothetical protein
MRAMPVICIRVDSTVYRFMTPYGTDKRHARCSSVYLAPIEKIQMTEKQQQLFNPYRCDTMVVFRIKAACLPLFLCCLFLIQEVSSQRAIVSLGKRLQNRFGSSQRQRPDASTPGENDASSNRQHWSYIAAAVVCVALGAGQFSYRRRRAADILYSDGEFDSHPNDFSTDRGFKVLLIF